MPESEISRIESLLGQLYPPEACPAAIAQIRALLVRYSSLQAAGQPRAPRTPDQRTALLITYGDQVRPAYGESAAPLRVLGEFLTAHAGNVLTGIHLLPFFPYSSDDGFSVMDYYAVDAALGGWDDIARIGTDFDLMFDAVINHASAGSSWFQQFLRTEPPGRDYFFIVPEDFDTSRVIRPRVLPLLTGFDTARGPVRVWTTFSADQIDLDYRQPALLLQILDVLLFYVTHGARLLRLDAIAFLWKESGTTCLHLPQTHAVIQLIRAVLDAIAPDVLLVTETNVPHADNISYFGDGVHEAQWVYNFALPPLTLHTLQTGDASKLAAWAATLSVPSPSCAFFNFLASHDGIGLNPARGILTDSEIADLTARTLARGGFLSYKNNPDGSIAPYEMNINYLDALTVPGEPEANSLARLHVAHAIQFALAGVPGIYFHSLFGSRGDVEAVEASGIPRRVNRQKLARDVLERELGDPAARRYQVFSGLKHLLQVKGGHPAFHPQSPQQVLQGDGRVFALVRGAGAAAALCLHNVSDGPVSYALPDNSWYNLLTGEVNRKEFTLPPYGVAWLTGLTGDE